MAVRRRGYALVAAAFLLLVGGGAVGLGLRSGDPAAGPEPAVSPSSPVPVIVPGRPGESAAVVPSDQLEIPDGARYNAWDVGFIRMMIPHHAQALALAALVPDRAGSPQVQALAERISLAQAAELDVLRAWLDARGLAGTDPTHDHGQMPGMQTPETIQALAATTGDAFDRRFVEVMTDHHQGAIDMAVEVLGLGADERVQELATSIAAEQSAEITRMREL
jgi:uncharacterized protein (DUF305 family)